MPCLLEIEITDMKLMNLTLDNEHDNVISTGIEIIGKQKFVTIITRYLDYFRFTSVTIHMRNHFYIVSSQLKFTISEILSNDFNLAKLI